MQLVWWIPSLQLPEAGGNISCCHQSPGQSSKSLTQTHCCLYPKPSLEPEQACMRVVSRAGQTQADRAQHRANLLRDRCCKRRGWPRHPQVTLPCTKPHLTSPEQDGVTWAREVWIPSEQQWEGKHHNSKAQGLETVLVERDCSTSGFPKGTEPGGSNREVALYSMWHPRVTHICSKTKRSESHKTGTDLPSSPPKGITCTGTAYKHPLKKSIIIKIGSHLFRFSPWI